MTTESKLITTKRFIKKVSIFLLILTIIMVAYGPIMKYISTLFNGGEIQIFKSTDYYLKEDKIFDDLVFSDSISTLSLPNGSEPIFSINGTFNVYPKSVFVYDVTIPKQTFLSVSNAQAKASFFGFPSEYKKIGKDLYFWESLDSQNNLSFDITKFKWKYVKVFDVELLPNNSPSSFEKYFEFTKNMGFDLPEEIVSNAYFVDKYENNLGYIADLVDPSYIFITSMEKKSMAAMNTENTSAKEFINSNKIGLKGVIYGDNPYIGNYNVVYSNQESPSKDNIVELEFSELVVGNSTGVYKIISVEEAFNRLQNSLGILKSLVKNDNEIFTDYTKRDVKEFIVKTSEVELGYYIDYDKPKYTHPIYIFKGTTVFDDNSNGKFIFYVNAIPENK